MLKQIISMPYFQAVLVLIFVAAIEVRASERANSVCDTVDYTLEIYGGVSNVFGTCSGRGTCEDNETRCECDDGWTGLSDFINTDAIDCQVHTTSIKVLWGIILLYSMYTVVVGIPFLKERWKSHLDVAKERRSRGKEYRIRDNPVLLACIWFYSFCFPSVVLYGILRISKNDERVGITPAATFLFFTAKIGFYMSLYLYRPTLFSASLGKFGKETGLKRVLKLSKHAGLVMMIVSITLGALPFIALSDGGNLAADAKTVYKLYMLFTAMSTFLNTLSGSYARIKGVKIMSNSYSITKNPMLLEVKKKFEETINAAEKQGYFLSVVFLLFFLVPFLWNKHDYFHPINWFAYIVLGKKVAMATVKSKVSTSGNGALSSNMQTSSEPNAKSTKYTPRQNSKLEMSHESYSI
mmetsp:Transcript_3282/g.4410  ORF Transcript_3282/g.4410 Transcript_3282/m.4410 type:complete len:409 (+) Transcript_3282:268-1494(+)